MHRVGEAPMTYKEGQVYDLRDDRAKVRLGNGTAVLAGDEGNTDGDAVEGTETVVEKDSGDTGKRAVNVPSGVGKGKGK